MQTRCTQTHTLSDDNSELSCTRTRVCVCVCYYIRSDFRDKGLCVCVGCPRWYLYHVGNKCDHTHLSYVACSASQHCSVVSSKRLWFPPLTPSHMYQLRGIQSLHVDRLMHNTYQPLNNSIRIHRQQNSGNDDVYEAPPSPTVRRWLLSFFCLSFHHYYYYYFCTIVIYS